MFSVVLFSLAATEDETESCAVQRDYGRQNVAIAVFYKVNSAENCAAHYDESCNNVVAFRRGSPRRDKERQKRPPRPLLWSSLGQKRRLCLKTLKLREYRPSRLRC